MRIGILTYHYSINEGAMLQAMALQETCQRLWPEATVEIIDYRDPGTAKRDLLSIIAQPRTLSSIIALGRRFQRLVRARREMFDLSARVCNTRAQEEAAAYINGLHYDVILVGSDEVWKILTHAHARPFPNVYWLHGVNVSKKLSYAASANKTAYEHAEEDLQNTIRTLLQRFDGIGVRDEYTERMAKFFLGNDTRIVRVLDPTFLYDFPMQNVESLLKKFGVNPEKKLVIFNNSDLEVSKRAAPWFKERGFVSVSVTTYDPHADIPLLSPLSPLEWVALYEYADFCLTERFHGTIFAMKTHTPFLSVESDKRFETQRTSKKESLLKELGMLDHFLYFYDEAYKEPAALHARLEQALEQTDFSACDTMIAERKVESIAYLQKYIGV